MKSGLIIISLFVYFSSTAQELELENLIFNKTELPSNCKIKEVNITDRLPCEANSNPFISSSSEYLTCFVGQFIRDTLLIQRVNRGLFSIYTDGAEIGIFAVKADSENTAKSIKENVELNSKNLDKSELFLSGRYFIWLWRDKGKSESFKELKIMIEKRID